MARASHTRRARARGHRRTPREGAHPRAQLVLGRDALRTRGRLVRGMGGGELRRRRRTFRGAHLPHHATHGPTGLSEPRRIRHPYPLRGRHRRAPWRPPSRRRFPTLLLARRPIQSVSWISRISSKPRVLPLLRPTPLTATSGSV